MPLSSDRHCPPIKVVKGAQPVAGIRWATAFANIKELDFQALPATPKTDVALMEIAAKSSISAVYTRNAFRAAPVTIAEKKTDQLRADIELPHYLLINSGNANAGTGQLGHDATLASCQMIADSVSGDATQVIPFSTGVIGVPLPAARIQTVASDLAAGLDAHAWDAAAQAILTTDTCEKLYHVIVEMPEGEVTLTGIAKGAGMIKPNMATMLAYIATDARVSSDVLDKSLSQAVELSFNRITVDGDTSTNDACVLAATGQSNVSVEGSAASLQLFQSALNALLQKLAQAIIRDAEGASKFTTLKIQGGASQQECLAVGYTVAESPLVKTALFASDANWGRILAAVGRAGLQELDVSKVEIYLGDHCVCQDGGRSAGYDEETASAIMAKSEIDITIVLNRGRFSETLWTSDLSHDYVRINAEYRT